MKRIVSILMIAIFCFMMTGCQNPIYVIKEQWRPSFMSVPGTTWESEDGTISLTVVDGDDETEWDYEVQMTVDGETIEFVGRDAEGATILFYSHSEEGYETHALMGCSFSKNKFKATVIERPWISTSEYFEIGEKFIFKKTEE